MTTGFFFSESTTVPTLMPKQRADWSFGIPNTTNRLADLLALLGVFGVLYD